jgi:hypothetical protein
MDNPPLAGIHFAKNKRRSSRANPIGSVLSHRSQLCFPRRAETFHVANEALAFGKGPAKRLCD